MRGNEAQDIGLPRYCLLGVKHTACARAAAAVRILIEEVTEDLEVQRAAECLPVELIGPLRSELKLESRYCPVSESRPNEIVG